MKCPYCEREMVQGMIQSPQEINWHPGKKRYLLGRGFLHDGSVILSQLSFLKGSAVVAWYCKDCGKILIDTTDENADLNGGASSDL